MAPPFTQDVVHAIQRIAGQFGATNVRVFGSYARGTAASSSDVDFLVDFPAESGGFNFVRFCDATSALLARPVDIVTERSLPAALRRDVLAQARPLAELAE